VTSGSKGTVVAIHTMKTYGECMSTNCHS